MLAPREHGTRKADLKEKPSPQPLIPMLLLARFRGAFARQSISSRKSTHGLLKVVRCGQVQHDRGLEGYADYDLPWNGHHGVKRIERPPR
jgi:hypothetical protein